MVKSRFCCFPWKNPIPLTFSLVIFFFLFSLFLCDSSAQMQSWLGTFNPERERRKVMNELPRRCISQCVHAHTQRRTRGRTAAADTQRWGISARAGLTPLVTLHVCETARSNLTL